MATTYKAPYIGANAGYGNTYSGGTFGGSSQPQIQANPAKSYTRDKPVTQKTMAERQQMAKQHPSSGVAVQGAYPPAPQGYQPTPEEQALQWAYQQTQNYMPQLPTFGQISGPEGPSFQQPTQQSGQPTGGQPQGGGSQFSIMPATPGNTQQQPSQPIVTRQNYRDPGYNPYGNQQFSIMPAVPQGGTQGSPPQGTTPPGTQQPPQAVNPPQQTLPPFQSLPTSGTGQAQNPFSNVDIGFQPSPVYDQAQSQAAVQQAQAAIPQGYSGALGMLLNGLGNQVGVELGGQISQANATQNLASQAAAANAGAQGAQFGADVYGVNQSYQNALLQLLSSLFGRAV